MIQWLILAGIIGGIALIALKPDLLGDLGLDLPDLGGGGSSTVPATDDDDDDDKDGGGKKVSLEGDMIDKKVKDAISKATNNKALTNLKNNKALQMAGNFDKGNIPGIGNMDDFISNTLNKALSGNKALSMLSSKTTYYPGQSWGIHVP